MAVPVTPDSRTRCCVSRAVCREQQRRWRRQRRRRHWLAATRQIDILLNRQPATSLPSLPALIKLHLPARGAADARRTDGRVLGRAVHSLRSLHALAHAHGWPVRATFIAACLLFFSFPCDGTVPAPKTQQKTATGAIIIPPGNGIDKSHPRAARRHVAHPGVSPPTALSRNYV